MRAGELDAVLLHEIVLLDFRILNFRDPPLSVGVRLVAARKFRDHPQWAECVHRVPLPTSRRPVGPYAPKRAHGPLGPRPRNMMTRAPGCKPIFSLQGRLFRMAATQHADIMRYASACQLAGLQRL